MDRPRPASSLGEAFDPTIGPDETLDRLTRGSRIIQKRRGHRAASDDVLLAWVAARACPEPRRILDLGSGKGTVALLLLLGRPLCRVIGVEALEASHDLAVRNALLNGLEDRYEPRLGDLRDPSVLAGEAPFDLITGAPPFMPVGSGPLPRDPARAAGRFELRGGVGDYARTASAHLAPGGSVVLLMDGLAASRARLEEALALAALFPRLLVAVRPRPERPAIYWIVIAGSHAGPAVQETLCMRPTEGDAFSPEYLAVRRELNLAD